MQSRRYDDLGTDSRPRDHGIKLDDDSYLRDGSPRPRRSLSPFRVDGSQRVMGGRNRRSGSLERREYGWDLGGGRSERVQLKSPHYGRMQNRPDYDELVLSEDELRQKNEFFDYVDRNTDVTTGLKHGYGYGHGTSGASRVQHFESAGQRILGTKSMILEDSASRGVYGLSADIGSSLRYVDGGGKFASSSVNADLDQSKDEKVRYPDSLLLSKLSAMESYGIGEKTMFHSRNVSYSMMPASPSKEVVGVSQFKDPASSSLGSSRTNFTGLSRDDLSTPMDGYSRNSTKLREPMEFSEYDQRHILDSRIAPQAEYRDLTTYWQDTLSPTMTEHRDYLCPTPGEGQGDYGYSSDKMRRKMTLHAEVDSGRRDRPRPTIKQSINEYVNNTEHSRRNPQNQSLWDRFSPQKQPNYIGTRRSSAALKQGSEYLDSGGAHVELGRKVLRERELPDVGVPQHHDFTHTRLSYGFGRDIGPVSHEEQIRRSSEAQYEEEMLRFAGRTERVKGEELGLYESDRMLKRKHIINEEIREHNSKKIMTGEWINYSRRQDSYNRGDKWINAGYDYDVYGRAERTFNGADHPDDFASEDWLSSHDLVENVQKHSMRPYKPGGKYIKGHSNPRSFSQYQSNGFSRKHGLPKPRNVWIRARDEKQEDALANEVEQSQDWVTSAKSEPPEDSEEFKQLVHKFFLSFTKKLNSNPVARKRYREQGRAGSLFCIVCGRSQSKEFMDTESLARHAFMSHKFGLRAQHLGLHRAISVLMEWNTVVSPDVVTWFPEAISSAEALAQKEDLILWPPVIVIHNSSISGNNTKGHDVITVEALVEFLRSKGISSGRIKVCLGKPSNHSTMVVKFLGTFSGLQDAEKLHKYFRDNNHGRKDFEKIASGKGRISNVAGELQGDKIEEAVLYGYMGIAEDLDKVDFDTKKKCSINSKEEIKDLADAPVKPE